MQFIELQARSRKIMKKINIQRQNHENHEIHRIPHMNYENHANSSISHQNQ